MLVRKANRVDLIRLLLQKQSDLGLPCVGSISSQLLMELTKWLFEITKKILSRLLLWQPDLGMSCLFWLL